VWYLAASSSWHMNIHPVFSTFTWPISSLLASNKDFCSFLYGMFLPMKLT
jgi:hypothetical protein